MTTELDDIARDYREIRAPEYIAARVRAETADRAVQGQRWLPAAAAATVAVAVLAMLPTLWQSEDANVVVPVKPSLSAIAAFKIDKPAVTPPSLSKIRTPSAPPMPSKPEPGSDAEQGRLRFEISEEILHAHT